MAAGGSDHRQLGKGRPQRLLFVVEEHRARDDGQGRGLFVPDFGLCFGLCPHRYCLCAFDLPADGQPPAARYVWMGETYPRECQDAGFHAMSPGSLAYLGDGKFCITWTIAIECDQQCGLAVCSLPHGRSSCQVFSFS